MRKRFGFSDDDLDQLDTWAREAGVRWAFDAEHRADFGLESYVANTWEFGLDRLLTGVALSDELQMLAHPTETIVLKKVADPVARIAALVAERNVELIVVGLPRHMNGSVGASAEEASGFAQKLKTKAG